MDGVGGWVEGGRGGRERLTNPVRGPSSLGEEQAVSLYILLRTRGEEGKGIVGTARCIVAGTIRLTPTLSLKNGWEGAFFFLLVACFRTRIRKSWGDLLGERAEEVAPERERGKINVDGI